jgi:tyrosine-protein phosphatase non-receptor type 9
VRLQAVKQFIDLLNSTSQHPRSKHISSAIALQYLYARKFDTQKAVALYEANILIRQREGLYGFNALVDPLRSELETGKFTILVSTFDVIITILNHSLSYGYSNK